MEYVTVEGVELATVGMEWPASTGPYSCTFEQLRDAMVAANEDPHVMSPRLKLGHTSELNGVLNVTDPFAELGDGAPAFGRVVNLRLENDGAVLVGDFVEVPAWLGEAMPSAYPSRSTEVRLSYTTEAGKSYDAVITAVALLGPVEPAIKDLDDLERFLISGPENVTAASRPEEGTMPAEQVDASVSSGTIRQRFNFEWAFENDTDLDTYWWWARDVFVDPSEVIADDDEGNCWSVPFTTDGKDEITFGEPVRVRETFVPVNASAAAVGQRVHQRNSQQVLASNLERPEKPAPKTAASTAQPDDEENTEMTIDLDKLRGRLGLPDDATEEQINEALAAEETPAAEETVTPTDEIPVEPVVPEAEPAGPVAASALPEGMVAVPADQWAAVQEGAKAGTQVAAAAETKRRDDTIAAAARVGKVAPAQREALCNMHANPATRESFYTLLTAEVKDGGLAPGLVPVTEIGEAGGREDGVAASAGLPGSWFPELANRNGAGDGAQED